MCSRQPRARCDDRRIENETTNTRCVLSVFPLGVSSRCFLLAFPFCGACASKRFVARPARSSLKCFEAPCGLCRGEVCPNPLPATASPECQDLIPPRAASRVCEDRFSHQACATLESRTDPWSDRAEHRVRRVEIPLEMRVHPERTTGACPGWWQRIVWMTIRSVNTPTDCAWWRAVRDRADRWGSRPVCSNACTE